MLLYMQLRAIHTKKMSPPGSFSPEIRHSVTKCHTGISGREFDHLGRRLS
jgi:hypothetical protein